MPKFFPLAVLILAFVNQAASFLCNEVLTINPPEDLNQAWFYPPNWSDSDTPPDYASGQNCTWVLSQSAPAKPSFLQINVPNGTFAYLSLKTITSQDTILTVTDSINHVTKIEYEYGIIDTEPFYFNSPNFTIQLKDQSTGKLGLKVTWFKYPVFTPQNYQVTPQGEPIFLSTEETEKATVLTADTQVSLVAINTPFDNSTLYTRATFVYDGPTWNSQFMGNLFDIMSSGKQAASTGKQMTIFTVVPGLNVGGAGSLIQDYSVVKDIVRYSDLSCAIAHSCGISFGGVTGKSAFVSVSKVPIYLFKTDLSSSASLKVYTGKISDTNLITTYRQGSEDYFPQKFPGYITTFVLDQGTSTVDFSPRSDEARWNEARDGRKGFFISENYLKPPTFHNNANEQINGNENYNFSLNVMESGIVGSATLQLTVFKKGKTVYDQTFSKDNQIPNSPIVAQGTGISVGYKTNGENTSGFMVEYEMISLSCVSSNYGFLIPIILAIQCLIAL